MSNKRLSVMFDKKPRHSKSTSNLSGLVSEEVAQPNYIQRHNRPSPKPPEQLSIMREYHFKAHPVPAAAASTTTIRHHQPRPQPQSVPPLKPAKAVMQARANTTPFMHPPDGLYLKMIRRRSASACLEEQRIQHEHRYYDEDEQMSVAIASALPPQFFDAPPAYASPDSDLKIRPLLHLHSRPHTPAHQKRRWRETVVMDEFYLPSDDALHAEIDETIAQYAMLKVTQPTPTSTRSISPMSATISPLNDIDQLYLEKRWKKR